MAALRIPAIVETFCLPRGIDLFDLQELESVRGICRKLAHDAACGYLVLDLSETEIFGAAFLGAVLLSRRRLAARGCHLVLSESNPLCAEVIEIANLVDLLRPPENILLRAV